MEAGHVCLLVYHYLPGSRRVVFLTDDYAPEPAERSSIATDYGHHRASHLTPSPAAKQHNQTHQRHHRAQQQQCETAHPHQRERLHKRQPRPVALRPGRSLYESGFGKGNGLMDGSRSLQRDVQERQQQCGRLHREQHTAVEGVETLTAQKQFVRQIENGLQQCHLYYIYKEHSHCDYVFRLVFYVCREWRGEIKSAPQGWFITERPYLFFTMSMSFFRSSTVMSSSFTSDETASR